MNVTLPAELKDFVSDAVADGCYPTASEVVRAGLRLLQESEDKRSAQQKQLRAALLEGVNDLANGRSKSYSRKGLADLAAEIKSAGRTVLRKMPRR